MNPKSWKEYHNQWHNRLIGQVSSALEKHLNQPVDDSDLKKYLWIERKDKNNQLNGIYHAPKEEIDKITSGLGGLSSKDCEKNTGLVYTKYK